MKISTISKQNLYPLTDMKVKGLIDWLYRVLRRIGTKMSKLYSIYTMHACIYTKQMNEMELRTKSRVHKYSTKSDDFFHIYTLPFH